MTSACIPPGSKKAYEFYIEMMLVWSCDECPAHIPASSDIRIGEKDAPFGNWASRQAEDAMRLGWYVPPLTEDGSLVVRCLCPNCAKEINSKEKNRTDSSSEHPPAGTPDAESASRASVAPTAGCR